MQSWLLYRTQQVVREGEYSEKSNVKSGVPQGTVSGPLCFLHYTHMLEYINDMGDNLLLFTEVEVNSDGYLPSREINIHHFPPH